MATYRLRHFSRPETLRAISQSKLREFLMPHHEFLAQHGLDVSVADTDLDVEVLSGLFMDPVPDTPGDLINALVYVDEMATPEAMDSLLAEIMGVDLGIVDRDEMTPADLAIHVWIADRNIIERKHAEFGLVRNRSYDHFQSGKPKPMKSLGKKALVALEEDLDRWFEKHNRGRGAKVIMFHKIDGAWLSIRHGDTYRREGRLDGFESTSVHFRPVKYDIVVYQPETGELRVNAKSDGEKQLYRLLIGRHFFKSDDHFPGEEKYTLEPLRTYGSASLNCVDIDGLDWVKLKEYQILYPGSPWQVISRKSDDMFALLDQQKRTIHEFGQLLRATFQVKFKDCKRPRSVVIRSGNKTSLTRDDDSALVEKWLSARGFIIHDAESTDVTTEISVEVA
jgi:hypothetical protein